MRVTKTASRHLSAFPLASSSSDVHTLVYRLVLFHVTTRHTFPASSPALTDFFFSRFGSLYARSHDTFTWVLRSSAGHHHTIGVCAPAASATQGPIAEGSEGARTLSDLHDMFKPRALQRASAPPFRAAAADAEQLGSEVRALAAIGVACVGEVVIGGPGDAQVKPHHVVKLSCGHRDSVHLRISCPVEYTIGIMRLRLSLRC